MTTSGHEMALRSAGALEFSAEQRSMIRDAFANGANDSEFAVLMEIARTRRLNPLMRQIHFVKRWNNDLHREVWAAQVAIDGLRAIAERTGLYGGQDEPEFVETPDGSLKCCKVRVYRTDWPRPAVGVAYWDEYVQTYRDKASGKVVPTPMWRKMPRVMLSKVAESIALRKAFPEDISGLYSPEEMGQSENDRAEPVTIVRGDGPVSPQLPPTSALDAFLADLADTTDLRSVGACWQTHAAALHGAGNDAAGLAAVTERLAARGYELAREDVRACLGGTLDGALMTALDSIAGIYRHADDEDGDGVVADVVRALRAMGNAPTGAKSAASRAGVRHATALGVADAKARITTALRPPQPPTTPTTPTGTDAPRAAATSADGGSVAPSQTPGAMASVRTVLDTDAAHVQVAGTWRESEAGWREHLAEMTVRKRVEASVGCNGALLGPAFIAMAAERIVEIDAARPLPAGVARLTVIGVTQTLERIALDGSRARAAAAQGERTAA